MRNFAIYFLILGFLILICSSIHAQTPAAPVVVAPISTAWDVPAVSKMVPAPAPCNLSEAGSGVCVTGPSKQFYCADSARVLMVDGANVRHCILFPAQQKEAVTVTVKPVN